MCEWVGKVASAAASLLESQQVVHSAQGSMAEVQGIRGGLRSSASLQDRSHPLLTTDVAQGSGTQVHISIGQSHKAQTTRSQGDGISS